MRIISPSLLSADFRNIQKDIIKVNEAGAKRIHLDVMDGHFVPALTFGPMIIKAIRQCTECHLETHLMIKDPHKFLDQYIDAGSDTIIIHLESSINVEEDLSYIRQHNVRAGIAINPNTNEKHIIPILDYLDYILIMSVFPGKGGQIFINDTLEKMKNIVSMREKREIAIGVDGGVNIKNIKTVYKTGIDITVVGSGLFQAKDVSKRYTELLDV